MNNIDKKYQQLLQDILDNGVEKKDRTGTGTLSVFGRQIRHKMREGFPLLTTKKMAWNVMVTELLWFLRGSTNIKFLLDYDCHIWDGDAYKNFEKWYNEHSGKEDYTGYYVPTKEEFIRLIKTDDEFAKKWGELGPIYGKQWRSWGERKHDSISNEYFIGIDQIQNLIDELKSNPDSRRLMVSAWNVGELEQMVLPPCHYGFQVYTRELSMEERWKMANLTPNMSEFDYCNKLCDENNVPKRAISLMWNQRSVDTFLGLPFNIASYGLLLEIIAKEVNMVPEELIGNLGDVHLYSNHVKQAIEQIGRKLTFDERTEMLKDKMGIDKYEKELLELVPFGGGMSEFYKYYKIPYETREPYELPRLKFSPCPITGIDMEYQSIAQFQIENYESHSTIKAPLSN